MEQPIQPSYRPISVQDTSIYDPLKGNVRIKRINYALADGTTSFVDIPLSEYSAERVSAELEVAARLHNEVMSVAGPPQAVGQPMTPHRWEQPA